MLRHDASASTRATLVGFGAVLLWGSLATWSVSTGSIPPLGPTVLAFGVGVGGGLGLAVASVRGRWRRLWPTLPALSLGVVGLFNDYALYFGSLRLAPPAQAALVLHEPLRPNHVLGGALGLAVVLVLATSKTATLALELRYVPGYAMALGAALVWAGYSVLPRRLADVSTDTLTDACLVAATLAGACHSLFEDDVAPENCWQVLAIVAVGIVTAGGAFSFWDVGVKRGNVRVLAVLGCSAPVLSILSLMRRAMRYPVRRWRSPACSSSCPVRRQSTLRLRAP